VIIIEIQEIHEIHETKNPGDRRQIMAPSIGDPSQRSKKSAPTYSQAAGSGGVAEPMAKSAPSAALPLTQVV